MAEQRLKYHIFVYGRVQGVGFRHWTTSLAREFGISGWVRNTENYNCVELLAITDDEATFTDFLQALKTEHPFAKVDACEVSRINTQDVKGFRVVR